MRIRKATMDKLTAMARCLASGGTVRKCLKEVGLSPDTYTRYKSLVWDMVKTMKKSEGKDEEEKEEVSPPDFGIAPPEVDEELGEAVKALERTVNFLDRVELIKRRLASKLMIPPSPPMESPTSEGEEKEEGAKITLSKESAFDILKNAQELLNQAKSFLESFGYLVVPPHERHRWYHEEEVKELIKKEKAGGGDNETLTSEQLKTVENIITKAIDRVAMIFEKALLGNQVEEKKDKIEMVLREIEHEESSPAET